MEEETKNEELAEEPKSEPTPEELAEKMKKQREAYEEEIVVACREKLMPSLVGANLSIKDSATIIDTLYQTIQQALLSAAKDKNMADLGISDNINADYPNSNVYINLLDAIKDKNIGFIINCIQWLSRKVASDLEASYKDKTFGEIVKEF